MIPATVFISKVGDAKDFFIELSNNSDYDVDISKWSIVSNSKNFILPKNTVVGSKSKIILSPKITNFTIADTNSLKLLKSTGEIAFDYNILPVNNSNIALASNKAVPNISLEKDKVTKDENVNSTNNNLNSKLENNVEIKGSDLGSAPVLSEISKNNNSNKDYFFFWGFVVLLFVSGGATYYIRGRNRVSKVGDDFKIIDE